MKSEEAAKCAPHAGLPSDGDREHVIDLEHGGNRLCWCRERIQTAQARV